MKTFKKLFLLLATSLFALTGCGTPKNPGNSGNSTSSSFTFNEETKYESTAWDENVYKMIEANVGDSETAHKIPVLPAEGYVTYFDKKQTVDMFDNPLEVETTRILAGGITELDFEKYTDLLTKNGFVYSDESNCFYAKASATDCIYIYYTFYQKLERVNLEIYRKKLRDNEWDDEVAYYILGRKIPHIEAPAYEYYFDSYSLEFYIYFVDVTLQQITDYQAALVKDGWYRKSDTSEFDIYSFRSDEDLSITMYQGVDGFNDPYLMVRLANAWPFYLIYASTGGTLPKCSGGVFSQYFTNENGEGSGNYYTQIEYENCTYDDYVSYCRSLEDKRNYNYYLEPNTEGPNPNSYVSSDTSLGTIYTSYYTKDISEDEIAMVDVMYSSGLNRLIIIIWA